jgi:hypothetical protein
MKRRSWWWTGDSQKHVQPNKGKWRSFIRRVVSFLFIYTLLILRLHFIFPQKCRVGVLVATWNINITDGDTFSISRNYKPRTLLLQNVFFLSNIFLWEFLSKTLKQNKLLYFPSHKNKHYFVIASAVAVIWLWAVDGKILLNKRAANNRVCQIARQLYVKT